MRYDQKCNWPPSDHFPHRLFFISSKMYILLNHPPEFQVFWWVLLCSYMSWSHAVISVSLCDGEYHASSIAKQFPQIDNDNLWVYEYSFVLCLHQYYLILSMMGIFYDYWTQIISCINWQFKALACICFVVSGFKDKKINPKRQIEFDFVEKKIILLWIICLFSFPEYVLYVSCLFYSWRLFQMEF